MADWNFSKIDAPTFPSACRLAELSGDARSLLAAEMRAEEVVERLLQASLFPDAVRLLAQALPNREATWWACLCARDILEKDAPQAIPIALEAAERWVYKPSEENRRLAMTAAEATAFDHPASWSAVAAFWSGGSLAPENNPVVPPAADLNGKAVAGAVMLAAAAHPERVDASYRRYLAQAIDIACGGDGRDLQAVEGA